MTNRLKAHLIIISTFILGIIVGGSGQYLMTKQQAPPRLANTTQEILEELSEKVGLEPDQKAKIEAIVDETFDRYEIKRNQFRPQFIEIRDDARRRVRDILSPDQQIRYDEWTREQDRLQKQKEKSAGK